LTMQSWNNTQNVKTHSKGKRTRSARPLHFALVITVFIRPTPHPHSQASPQSLPTDASYTGRKPIPKSVKLQGRGRALEKGEIACLVRGASSSLQQLGPPACLRVQVRHKAWP
jgi:hypothetical protein